ncbi:MAG TPA: peptidoglycan DD-metalloendopeptidase family protein [Pyrinomonadaceae bacterium]|jgi:murein DD-endopeptidase MepM/ murein hydrolase activator NlpD|nr:peptidoglycan DD-metalloendopeptidase family protein [Pyrinomonadaceae bacterium]
MALACTWGGYADSDVEFSKFIGDNHTISIRFLMQYPLAYAGAFFSVHGAGRYFVGQGDFQSLSSPTSPGKTNLLIMIGTQSMNIPVSGDGWHHVALVRTGNEMEVFIDGLGHRPFRVPTNHLPVGTLRFGSGFSQPHGVGGQFYGLLDDFALFKTDLSAERIKSLAGPKRLTDDESLRDDESFLVGYVFRNVRPTSLPPRLRRQLDTKPPATFVEVSDIRNPTLDLPKIPLPLNSPMHLPFAPGEVWRVGQGYQGLQSHHGYAAFCWDIVRDGAIGGSDGEMIYSASSGKVRDAEDGFTNPVPNPQDTNFVSVRNDDDLCCDYLHIKTDSALVSPGAQVNFGTRLALVGDIGVEGPHLHMAVSNGNPSATFFTMPAAFSNYEAEIDGDWKLIIRGIPQSNQRVRRPLDEGPIRYTAVWQRGTGAEIQMYGVTYEQYRAKYDSIWNDNWRLALLETVGVDDRARYTAVWRPTGGSEFQLYGATKAELEAENDKRHSDGWRIDLLTSYVVDGQARYTGVWRPSDQRRPMMIGETLNTLNARDQAQRDQGFRLHRLSTHSNGVEARYSAIWRLSNEEEEPFFDRTEHDYRAAYGARLELGVRVKLLSIAVVNGEPKYSGAFVKQANPGDEERWHAVSYGDLRARYDVLWQQGWRLKLLEPYVS